ncbi:MAG: tetratricopeptide repeat protein [Nitrospirae bacterium]|nr:tetratricopeptide repeat protein [Nitrospirota bacterium]
MFALSVTGLLIVILIFVAYPLWRRTPKPLPVGTEAARGEERLDLEIEKRNVLQSIRELEEDLAGGKITEGDYQRLRAVDEHRLAGILDRIDVGEATRTGQPAPAQRAEGDLRRFRIFNLARSVVIMLLVAAGASGIYYYNQSKTQAMQQAAMEQSGGPAQGMQGAPNPMEMVARLERRLRENPDDLQGQIMAGRSYTALQRMDDAWSAWTKVVELDPHNSEGHYNLGLLLIQSSQPSDRPSFERALLHFDTVLRTAPETPAALFYRGVALAHLQRNDEAERSFKRALAGLEPGSEDAQFVEEQIRQLREGNPKS